MFYIRPLLSKLRHLFIHGYDIPVHEIVSHCTQLKALHVECSLEIELPAITIPNLVKFKISDNPSLIDFLLMNPQIEEFETRHGEGLVQLIVTKMPNIRKVKLDLQDLRKSTFSICVKSNV